MFFFSINNQIKETQHHLVQSIACIYILYTCNGLIYIYMYVYIYKMLAPINDLLYNETGVVKE